MSLQSSIACGLHSHTLSRCYRAYNLCLENIQACRQSRSFTASQLYPGFEMEKNALALQQVHMHCDVQCVMIRCSPCLMQVSNSITMWHIETRKLCSTTDVNYEAHIIHTIQGSLGSVIVGPPDTHTPRATGFSGRLHANTRSTFG
jgi:hypothetical protein